MRTLSSSPYRRVLSVVLALLLACAGVVVSPPAHVSAQGDLTVVAVPWRGDLPHPTYNGATTVLKAIARNVNTPATYRWSFGDGAPDEVGSVTDPYVIEALHTYPPSPDGTPFTAVCTVTDAEGNTASAVYRVIVRTKTLNVETDKAIDDGLWYLHKTMHRHDEGTAKLGWWEDQYGEWGEGEEVINLALAAEALMVEEQLPVEQTSAGVADDSLLMGATYSGGDNGVPNPHFRVDPHENSVWGHEWPAGAELTVTIDGGEGLAELTAYANEWGDFDLWDLGGYDIAAGDVVTVTDGVTVKEHVVTSLTVTEVDIVNDIVRGNADPGSEVWVHAENGQGYSHRSVFADAVTGEWEADFSVAGGPDSGEQPFDIGPGTYGHANQRDDDGDATFDNWRVPNPHFNVDPEGGSIWGHEWIPGATITVTLNDVFLTSGSAEDNGDFNTGVDPSVLDTGQTVRVTDGVSTKEHVITALRIAGVDETADTVLGVAAPDSDVAVEIYDVDGGWRRVTAGASGEWLADYSVPGDGPDEHATFDFQPGFHGAALQNDEDGDGTRVHWRVPNPHFYVNRQDDHIWGHEWSADTELTMTIDGGEGPAELTAYANEWGDFWLDVGWSHDIQAGDLVTVTDGVTVKEHVVTELRDVTVNADADTVSGYAEPGSEIHVEIHLHDDWRLREVTADPVTGEWIANFLVAVGPEHWQQSYDIVPGTSGAAVERDEDGDGTWIDWCLGTDNWGLGITALAVEAFEVQGHLPSGDYDKNPYVETVQRGLNYVLWNLTAVPIGMQPAGDPDSSGNGIGLGVHNGDLYTQPMALMAITASLEPDRVAEVGREWVLGRTYREIAQDMVDYIAWAQNEEGDARGGWRYSPNSYRSDNSVTQWPVIALFAAEANMDILAPPWVRTELDLWLAYSQNQEDGPDYGGFGYTHPQEWVNGAKTGAGIAALSYVGLPSSDTRIQDALDYLDRNWSLTGPGDMDNFGNYYAMYAVMKGMRLADPQITHVGTHVWYAEYARYLAENQRVDGSWAQHVWGGYVTGAAWSLLILTPTVLSAPPVAVIDPSEVTYAPGVPLALSGEDSYHLNPKLAIASYEWDFDGDGVWDATGPTAEHTYPIYYLSDGSIDEAATYRDYTVTLRVTDDAIPPNMDTVTAVVRIAPPPYPPIADAGGPYHGVVGVPVALDGSGSYDLDEGPPWYDEIVEYAWELDGAYPYDFDDAYGEYVSWVWDSPGIKDVGLRVTDSSGLSHVHWTTATIVETPPDNTPPVADAGGPYLVAVGESVTLDGSGSYDLDGDALTYEWAVAGGTLDDATLERPTFTAGSEAGIYDVTLTVTDEHGAASNPAVTSVVVYDPSSGFVTGGGWLYSPPGAYAPDAEAEGKASFGFVSRYRRGANKPDGNTQFQFRSGELNFRSADYEWLVVTGNNYARFKGSGTINGEGSYQFMIWAGDGTGTGGADTFRIKIWTEDDGTETIVYDNGMDQPIDGGSIVVHASKK